jgi:hypothetical protein
LEFWWKDDESSWGQLLFRFHVGDLDGIPGVVRSRCLHSAHFEKRSLYFEMYQIRKSSARFRPWIRRDSRYPMRRNGPINKAADAGKTVHCIVRQLFPCNRLPCFLQVGR